MNFFKNMLIRNKLLFGYSFILLLSAFLGSVITLNIVSKTIKSNIDDQLNNSNTMILNMVQTATTTSIRSHLRAISEKNLDITGYFYNQYKQGFLSEVEAKKRAENVLLSQTIGKTGYIYCTDSNGVIQVHPKKVMHGQDLSEHGFIKTQIINKLGYLEYDWANPGEPAPRPKALYMVHFKPWDWIISASSYRAEFTELIRVDDFKISILSISLGKSGYPYVIDSKGNVIFHPNLETGTNFFNTTDTKGRKFVQEMCRKKSGKITYTWKNPGEQKHREKLVVFNYIKELDWIVISSIYFDEFYEPIRTISFTVLITMGISLVLIFALTWWISSAITRPLNELMLQFDSGTKGASEPVVIRSDDEIGRLTGYYNTFISERNKAEKELIEAKTVAEQLSENLEKKVVQRTSELNQAFNKAKEKEQEISHINQVVQTVNSTLNLDKVMESAMNALKNIFDFNQISIYLINNERNTIELSNWYGEGVNPESRKLFESFPLSLEWKEVYFVKSVLKRIPYYISLITPELLEDYSERDLQMFNWNPHKSILICPIELQQKCIGCINFIHTETPFYLKAGIINQILRYVSQIATAINNAKMAEETQKALTLVRYREKEIAHINQVIQTTNSTLNFDEVFDAILAGLNKIIEFDVIGIQLVNEEQNTLDFYKAYGKNIQEKHIQQFQHIRTPLTEEGSSSSYVFNKVKPVYYDKITLDTPFSKTARQIFEIFSFTSYLAYPLVVQNKTIGVISFFSNKEHIKLEESEISKIERYVTAISTAIKNAKNHEQLKYTNEMFGSLLEASTSIHHQIELNDIFKFTLKQLHDLFPSLGFGLILHGGRPEIIDFAASRGISEDELQRLLKNPAQLLEANAETDLSTFMNISPQNESHDSKKWLLLPMKGKECKVTGNLIVKGDYINQQAKNIITLFIEQVTSITENKLLTIELEKLANTDGLTNTYNRFYFDREMERTLTKAVHLPNNYFSIMLIDVNGLKAVNDTFGHEDGDAMIKIVADLLIKTSRETDIVCRLGGDEFVLLSPNTNYESANTLLARIRDQEKDTELICQYADEKEEVIPIRVSIGLASSEDTPPDEVLKKADTRMYADKKAYYENHNRYR